jgi:acetyltransferase-like isoleucine patch superfamily enzyme
MLGKLKNLTVFGLLNKSKMYMARMKTQLFYRPFFGSIGRASTVFPPLLIANPKGIHLGKRVMIRDGVRLELLRLPGKGLPRLEIGDNVNIEQYVHIICGSSVRIGNNVSITGGAAIVDVNHPYSDIHDPTKIGDRIECEGNAVEIGDNVFIGFGAIVLPNVRIGKNSVIGAYSVVNKDVPDFSVVAGNPAKVLKKYCFEENKWVNEK